MNWRAPSKAFLICHVQLFKPPEISLTRLRLFDPCNFLNWKSSVWTCFHCLPVSNNTGVIQTKSHPRHPPTHHSTSAIKFLQILQDGRIFMTSPERFSSLTLTNHRCQRLVTIEKPPGPMVARPRCASISCTYDRMWLTHSLTHQNWRLAISHVCV